MTTNSAARNQRQEEAKRYASSQRRLWVLQLALGVTFVLWIVFGGWSGVLRDLLSRVTTDQAGLVALMFVSLSVSYALLLWPISCLSGFQLPKRHGLSIQSFPQWMWDWLKTGLIGLVLGGLVVEVLYFLLGAFPDVWWLLAGIVMLLLTVVLTNLAPVLLVPLFYKLTPLDDESLVQRLLALAKHTGTQVRDVCKMDMSSKTTAANAALMGLGNTRRIVLGDTLLANYDADEIETVLAHELGHHAHGDIAKGIALQSLLTLVALYLIHLVLRWGVSHFGYNGPTDIAAMPLLALVSGAFGLATMPLGNSFSRYIEKQADQFALEHTGKPQVFARAMSKLADQNLSDLEPPRWVEIILHDHPATSKRIAMAQAFQKKQ